MTHIEFSRPVVELIEYRTSIRTYSKEQIEEKLVEKFTSFLESPQDSPFGGECNFHVINLPELDPNEAKKLGTYGTIKGTQNFIVVTAKRAERVREHVGYVLEKFILLATDLGLGTCWIGGIFKKENFARQVNLPSDEFIPAITPIGYPAKKRSLIERGMRTIIRANKKNRFPWSKLFFEGDFYSPLSKEKAGEIATALEMIRLGPSATNAQPWRVIKIKDIYHFFAKPRKNSYRNITRLDLGIATCHFDLTVAELGIKGKWVFQEPGIEVPEGFFYAISWEKD
ncbi:MAG: nitroreductase family protein [Candidatus Hodarchaeota archaeon]